MTVFDCDKSFWLGMAIVGGLTLAFILVCWLIPPKKEKRVKIKTE